MSKTITTWTEQPQIKALKTLTEEKIRSQQNENSNRTAHYMIKH